MKEAIRDFSNWSLVAPGYYIFPLPFPGVRYEILITSHVKKENLSDANAALYLCKIAPDRFDRVLKYQSEGSTVRDCVEYAQNEWNDGWYPGRKEI